MVSVQVARQVREDPSSRPIHDSARSKQERQRNREDSANVLQARHGRIHWARRLQAEEQGGQVEVCTTFFSSIHFLLSISL